jgi:hypothetical protein
MTFSSRNIAKLFSATLALSTPQVYALPIEDCIRDYMAFGIRESCTPANIQAVMSVYFKKVCQKPGPKKDGSTPACCFITPQLVRVTANEAFDAFLSQTIDDKKGVLMIDVRTPDEVCLM